MRAAITMLVAATTIGLSVSPATANVVDGSLDPSFGSDGIVTVDFPGYAPQANAVLVRPNGQAVLAGGDLHEPPSPNVLLAGLRRDGSLDPRFGSGGRVVTPLTATDGAEGAVAIAQQTNKRFIVGASTLVFGELGFALLGYLRNGTLDPSFGVGGITTALPAPQGAALQALVIQPDRKIVAVGGGNDAEGNATFVAARFTPSGALDPTFAGTGTRIIDTPEGDAEASAVTLQRDGKIVIAGTAQTSTGAYNTFAR